MIILTKPFLIGLNNKVNEDLNTLKTKLTSLNRNHSDLLEEHEKFCLVNTTYNSAYESYGILPYNKIELSIYDMNNKTHVDFDTSLFKDYDIKRIQTIENILIALHTTNDLLNNSLKHSNYTKGNKTLITNIIKAISKELNPLTIKNTLKLT